MFITIFVIRIISAFITNQGLSKRLFLFVCIGFFVLQDLSKFECIIFILMRIFSIKRVYFTNVLTYTGGYKLSH